jgi:hypothetical protein
MPAGRKEYGARGMLGGRRAISFSARPGKRRRVSSVSGVERRGELLVRLTFDTPKHGRDGFLLVRTLSYRWVKRQLSRLDDDRAARLTGKVAEDELGVRGLASGGEGFGSGERVLPSNHIIVRLLEANRGHALGPNDSVVVLDLLEQARRVRVEVGVNDRLELGSLVGFGDNVRRKRAANEDRHLRDGGV